MRSRGGSGPTVIHYWGSGRSYGAVHRLGTLVRSFPRLRKLFDHRVRVLVYDGSLRRVNRVVLDWLKTIIMPKSAKAEFLIWPNFSARYIKARRPRYSAEAWSVPP